MSYFRKKTLGRYGQAVPATVQPFTFPASVGGVNAVDSLMMMPPEDCIYTYNLMPSEYGLRMRKGYKEWATNCVESPQRAENVDVRTIIPFESNIQDVANDRLFAVTAEGIWDVTLFGNTAPTQTLAVFAQTSDPAGYGVWCEFTGDAAGSGLRGHYMFYADGLNGIWQYEEATDEWSQPPAGIGATDWWYIDPDDGTTKLPFPVSDVAFVMVFKQRIWVILEDEDDAWYLPTASVSGELKKFTFGSKMPRGGNLMGLFNWTVDGGDGVDDMMVAISRGGDVIVYQGEDPEITPDGSSVGPWSTRGAWFIGEVPNSRRIAVDFGPDLYILSTYGLTSLNDLLQGAPAFGQTPSRKVNRFLRSDVENGKDSSAWQLTTHPADGFLQIITPKPSQARYLQYNMNLQTGSWGFWEGVPIFGADSWSGDYYMGGENGIVYINDGGLDGTELDKPNFFQDVPNPAPGAEWTVPLPLEFACDGTQAGETEYRVDMTQSTVIGANYELVYDVEDGAVGDHFIKVGSDQVIPTKTGDGTFVAVFVAGTVETTMAIVAESGMSGTFTNVTLRVQEASGQPITFRTLTSFQAPAGHSNFNRVGLIRSIGVLAGAADFSVQAVYDYNVEELVVPPAAVDPSGLDLWDSAIWDQALWDFGIQGKSFTGGSLGMGRTFAVAINGSTTTRLNIVAWDCLFTTGGLL